MKLWHDPGHTKNNMVKDLHQVLGESKAVEGFAEQIGHWIMTSIKQAVLTSQHICHPCLPSADLNLHLYSDLNTKVVGGTQQECEQVLYANFQQQLTYTTRPCQELCSRQPSTRSTSPRRLQSWSTSTSRATVWTKQACSSTFPTTSDGQRICACTWRSCT